MSFEGLMGADIEAIRIERSGRERCQDRAQRKSRRYQKTELRWKIAKVINNASHPDAKQLVEAKENSLIVCRNGC